MAALPPSADVFHLERRRLEEAAADLRSLLAEKNQQLSEQCAKCANEEERLLRSKYLAEIKEVSLQKDTTKAKHLKNTNELEHREMDLHRAEERKRAVEEYQSHLRSTESKKNDLLGRVSQLKAKQGSARENLKSQLCHVLESYRKEEAKLSQQLRLREEDFARKEEACATSDMQGMTLQEHLAADLKHQIFVSQQKVASLEASVESMQAKSLQKDLQVEEMIQSCDTDLKQKASKMDAEKQNLKREEDVNAGTLAIQRLQEADSLAKDLQEKLRSSGLADRPAAEKAPEEEWIAEKMRLEVQVAARKKQKVQMEADVKKLEEVNLHSRGTSYPEKRLVWATQDCYWRDFECFVRMRDRSKGTAFANIAASVRSQCRSRSRAGFEAIALGP